ncbi:MAG: PEP-CTERM sorting domain-containing protein [Alphaproteobacteria bacterium]|nr:PEP-CTERM sorting domain-containing protein [Alphaproteobacteria bacterium]MDE2043298.1 PEP-CTERM sorting domain-containing protein [Alphaproteobacteria bacterium]MDE2341192.1 PEP-CTERM sorting domain-containing protein [Alphaproteobacteria bacterium]
MIAGTAAASALANGSQSGGHVHYCGCGHPGYVAPACLHQSSSTSSSGSSSSTSSGSSASSSGSTGSSSASSSSGGSTSSGNPVPEPADYALFALGVGGLIIGQRAARRAKRDQIAEHEIQNPESPDK